MTSDGAKKQEPTTQVEQQLDRLERVICRLVEIRGILEARLAGVLVPREPEPASSLAGTPPDEYLVPLASALRGKATAISAENELLDQMVARLEV